MTPEEMAVEREAYRLRQQAKRKSETPHEKRPYKMMTPMLKRGQMRKLREDEYVPELAAVRIAQACHRG
jgi:hypothetical protein